MPQENQFPTFQTSFYFFRKALHEVKGSGLQFSFNIFQQHSIWYTIKTNCVKLQTIGPEIWSIQTFQKRVQEQFLHYNLSEIFREKSYSCYILLADRISLSGCLYFLRFWAICVLPLFVFQVGMSKILKKPHLSIKPFFYMIKNSKRKFRYLEEKASF